MSKSPHEHEWERYGSLVIKRADETTTLPLRWCVHCRRTHPDDPTVTFPTAAARRRLDAGDDQADGD
ncbi:MAG: hypothetical protein JWP11_2841 [Frankiales bacterium]|nr:hypothetical protein [Frankiales bacterium]